MNVEIDLSEMEGAVNPEFFPLLKNEDRYLVMRGGAGSGKSHFAAQKILLRILDDLDKPFKHVFLILRKTAPSARKSIWPLFRNYISAWGLDAICQENKTEMTFTFPDGSVIMCTGLDDPEKIKSIEGVTSIWMEEATEMGLQDFRQVDLRLRGLFPTYFQIMLTFNPISDMNWVFNEFFAETSSILDTTTHFSTYKSNLFLDEVYKRKLEELIDRDYWHYKVYTLGEWGSLDHVIFNNWKVVSEFPTDVKDVVCGLDFGYTHPCGMVMLGITDEGIYVKQLLHLKKQHMGAVITRMKRIIPQEYGLPNELSFNTPIYCDSALPGNIAQVREAGFNAIPVSKGRFTVKEGIDALKQHKLFITKDSEDLLREIRQYKYKEDKDGNVYDEPVKLGDDLMDAMRYAAYMRFRKQSHLGVLFIEM